MTRTNPNQVQKPRRAKPGSRKANPVPDWFGCGRIITTESWNGFLAARKAYYENKRDDV